MSFAKECAKKLLRYKKTETIQTALRDKYSFTSYATAISQVRRECMRTNVRHDLYETDVESLKSLKAYNTDEFQRFLDADLETQYRTQKHHQKTFPPVDLKTLRIDSSTSQLIACVRLLPDCVSALRLTDTEIVWSKARRAEALVKKSSKSILVVDASKLIEAARVLLQSEDYYPALVGLAVITGRRMIELAKTGTFESQDEYADPRAEEHADEHAEHRAMFRGQAKKKFAEFLDQLHYTIPLLAPFAEVNEAFQRIRGLKNFDDVPNDAVHTLIGVQANAAAKQFLSQKDLVEFQTEPTFHNARVLYGNLSFVRFEHSMSINLWLKNVLGHESLETSLNYSNCTVKVLDRFDRLPSPLGNTPGDTESTRKLPRCSDEGSDKEYIVLPREAVSGT